MKHNDSTLKRKCHGIWIPIHIWENEDLAIQEKILLAEIHSFDNGDGCWASNNYFGRFLEISKDRVSRLISSLIKKGLISSTLIYAEDSKQVVKRYLKIIDCPPIGENTNTPGENTNTPIGENTKDINKENINKENIKKSYMGLPSETHEHDENQNQSNSNQNKPTKSKPTNQTKSKAERILKRLNEIGNKPRGFKPTQANLKNIIARLKEGFSYSDCIKVLETKILDPHFINNPQFYNPETLFRPSKFEKYLNETPDNYKRNGSVPANGSGISGKIEYEVQTLRRGE